MSDIPSFISELQVLHSAAGYYIGDEYYDEDIHCWLPWSRRSQEYWQTYEEAFEALKSGKYAYRPWI